MTYCLSKYIHENSLRRQAHPSIIQPFSRVQLEQTTLSTYNSSFGLRPNSLESRIVSVMTGHQSGRISRAHGLLHIRCTHLVSTFDYRTPPPPPPPQKKKKKRERERERERERRSSSTKKNTGSLFELLREIHE